ncbi:hypothetical protein R84981_002790 [Carnimonas sp. R-84981]|uniref:hypothetical protein n=1 Tax=Carnimonas bestiolae TaxID=3402172 RepID=UPI003EDC631B
MSKRQPVYFRAVKVRDADGNFISAFVPASATDANTIRERGVNIGAVVRVDLTKNRNIEFHRLAHAIGGLCVQHIDAFEGMTHHKALKKLQQDSGIQCDVTITQITGMGVLESRQPKSMAFDAMDQTEFFTMVTELCQYIARTYWPSMTGEQVEDMAQAMVQERAA